MNRARDTLPPRHNAAWVVLTVILVQAVIFRETALDMVEMWRISVYRHCWVIVPLALFLVARRDARIEPAPYRLSWLALVLLPLLILLWLVADRASIRALEHASFVVIVVVSIAAVIGLRRFHQLLFPLLLLLGAIPVGDFLIPVLMDWTADISAVMLTITGLPAWRQGAIITLPNGVFFVAEVCSGVSFVLASLILSLVYSYLTFTAIWKRAIFVVATVASFILLNGVRAFLVMVIANATNMRWFTGWDHIIFGYLLFFVLAVVIFRVGETFADQQDVVDIADRPAARTERVAWPRVGIVAAVTLVTTLFAATALKMEQGEAQLPAVSMQISGCSEAGPWPETYVPELVGAVYTAGNGYRCERAVVGHFVAHFDDPRSGSELVNYAHRYWPSEWAQIGTLNDYQLRAEDTGLDVAELSFETAGKTRLVWYLFAIGDRVTANRYVAKFWEAMYIAAGKRRIAALHIVTAELAGDADEARAALDPYITVHR